MQSEQNGNHATKKSPFRCVDIADFSLVRSSVSFKTFFCHVSRFLLLSHIVNIEIWAFNALRCRLLSYVSVCAQ